MSSLKGDIIDKSKDVTEAAEASGGTFDFDGLAGTILLKFVKVLEAAAILIVTYFIVRKLKGYFLKIENTHEQQKTALNLLEKITTGFVIVIGITLALKIVGLDMSLFVGVVLLGLSYGLKDIIKNYIAGILIFMKAPFKIGDIVKIQSHMGKVEHMELQSTTVKTFDNKNITIYNSDVMTKAIINYSRYPMRRLELNAELAYGSNTEKATKTFSTILDNMEKVLKRPKYRIIFKKFTETGLIFQIKFWVPYPCDILGIKSELAFKIHQSFDEKELLTPFGKSFESGEPFKPTEEQARRIAEFYNSPAMQQRPAPTPLQPQQSPQQGQATVKPGHPQIQTTSTMQIQPVPEYVDLDEPE